jgi:hypothetical protein
MACRRRQPQCVSAAHSLFLVQLLLPGLSVLLGSLLAWEVLRDSWTGCGLVGGELGVRGGVFGDGLDRELLLTLTLA